MARAFRWVLIALVTAASGCGSGDKASSDAAASAQTSAKSAPGERTAASGGTPEERLGIDAATAGRGSIDSVITGSGFGLIGSIITPFKALPVGDRADVVRSLALCMQAYYQSDEFKADYVKIRLERKPQPPTYDKTPEQQVDESIADSKKQLAEARKNLLPMLPEANRAEVEQSYRDNEKMLDDPTMRQYQLTGVQAERTARQTDYEQSLQTWEQTYPEDPQTIVVQRLKDFIALADSIDFDAKLVVKDGRKIFADPSYESKPADWKWAFRTGRDTVAAAREVAANWLAELQ